MGEGERLGNALLTARTHRLTASLSRVPAPAAPRHRPLPDGVEERRDRVAHGFGSGGQHDEGALLCRRFVPSTGASTKATPGRGGEHGSDGGWGRRPRCSAAARPARGPARASGDGERGLGVEEHGQHDVGALRGRRGVVADVGAVDAERFGPAGVRFQARSGRPAEARLRAIGAPMRRCRGRAMVAMSAR